MRSAMWCRMGLPAGLALSAAAASVRAQCGTAVQWHGGGNPTAMTATPTRVYAAAPNLLRIYDSSNAADLALVSSYVLDGRPTAIEKDGSFLYVALGDRGVEIVDITNEAAPSHAYSIAGGDAQDLALAGGTLFIVWNGDLRLYDVSNPAAPAFRSTYASGFAKHVEARAGFAYLLDLASVASIDCTNPAAPVFRSSDSFYPNSRGMDVRPGTLAVAVDDEVLLYDITNPAALAPIATIHNASPGGGTCEFGQAGGVPVLYFENGNFDLDSVSLANPASPQPIPHGEALLGGIVAAPPASRVFVSSGASIMSYAPALNAAPQFLGSEYLGPSGLGGLVAFDQYVVSVAGTRLTAYDVTSPLAPVIVSETTLPDSGVDLASVGRTVYVVTFDNRFMTYDMSNPAAPVLAGEDTLRTWSAGLAVSGSTACVLMGDAKLDLYNTADPTHLRRKSSTPIGAIGSEVIADGGTLYVRGGTTIDVYDISDPGVPTLIHTRSSAPWPYVDMALHGRTLFTADSTGRVELLDVADPGSPALRSTFNAAPSPRLHPVDSLLIVSASSLELAQIVDAASPTAPVLLPQTLRTAGTISYSVPTGRSLFAGYPGQGVETFDLPGLPRLLAEPVATPVCNGAGQVELSVTLAEAAGATYQWRRGGGAMLNGTTVWGTTISGVHLPTLTLTNPHAQDIAFYDCVITNACGTITTRTVSLFPGVAPTIVGQPGDAAACPDGAASFSVAWLGTLPATFQWQAEVPPGSGTFTPVADGVFPRFTVDGATTRVLSIAATPGNTLPPQLALPRYRCVITNTCGSTTTRAAAFAFKDPDLTQDGNADQDDVAYLINVVGGGPNPSGIDPDLNADGNVDQDDVRQLIEWIAGGACP